MVGVAGRSKACKTCKQRKVACSLEKPECGTCVKSKRVCGGYHRDRIFLLDQRTRDSWSNTEAKSHSALTNSPSNWSQAANPPKVAENLQRSIPTKTAYSSLWNISNPSTRDIYRTQILNEFLYASMPQNRLALNDTASSYSKGETWLTMLPSLSTFTAALEATILAVSTAKLGRINGDEALVRESLKFYIQGLWELQKALWNPDLMYKDETVSACMALVMYEVVECPDQTIAGWTGHMKGLRRLFELKGPRGYTSEFGHKLFISFRQLEIQQAIVERRSTFLTGAEWVDIPWKGHIKPISHRLLDIMAEIANVIASAYQLFQAPEQVADPAVLFHAVLDILNRCWKLDARLRAFYKRLESQKSGPIYWPKLSIQVSDTVQTVDDPGKVFPVAFQFQNLAMAHTCQLYWATCAILWSGMGVIYQILESFQIHTQTANGPASPELNGSLNQNQSMGFHPSQLPPLEHRADVAQLGKNICQSIEYCMQDSLGSIGTIQSIFPMKVAIEAMSEDQGCAREILWAEATMQKIQGSGVRILGHLGVPLTQRGILPDRLDSIDQLPGIFSGGGVQP